MWMRRPACRGPRRAGAEMRFEDMGLDLQIRARKGFLQLARAHPAPFQGD